MPLTLITTTNTSRECFVCRIVINSIQMAIKILQPSDDEALSIVSNAQ